MEKPKKVDDRKLKKAAAEYEKALQAYEKLQFSALGDGAAVRPGWRTDRRTLYSLPN